MSNTTISSPSQLITLVSEQWLFWYLYNTLGERKELIALFIGEKLRQKRQLGSCSWSPTGKLQQSPEWKPNPNTTARELPYSSEQLTFEIPFRLGVDHAQLKSEPWISSQSAALKYPCIQVLIWVCPFPVQTLSISRETSLPKLFSPWL